MKCLIVLALAALAHAVPVPQDTPEVAAAKAAHLAEVSRAAAAVGVPHYPYVVVTPEGFIPDTPEVAAAKSAHFAEVARAAAAAAAPVYPYYSHPYAHPYAYSAYPYGVYSTYSGPIAIPAVLPSGHLADTPEVAAAKAAHFAEVAKAQAQA